MNVASTTTGSNDDVIVISSDDSSEEDDRLHDNTKLGEQSPSSSSLGKKRASEVMDGIPDKKRPRIHTALVDVDGEEVDAVEIVRLRRELEAAQILIQEQEKEIIDSRKDVVFQRQEVEKLNGEVAKNIQIVEDLKASVGDDLEKFQEHLACEMCMDTFKFPLVLADCGHTYCEKCLSDWFHQAEPNLTCPTCRANVVTKPVEIRFPKQIIADLKMAMIRFDVGDPQSSGAEGEGEERDGEAKRYIEGLFNAQRQRVRGRPRPGLGLGLGMGGQGPAAAGDGRDHQWGEVMEQRLRELPVHDLRNALNRVFARLEGVDQNQNQNQNQNGQPAHIPHQQQPQRPPAVIRMRQFGFGIPQPLHPNVHYGAPNRPPPPAGGAPPIPPLHVPPARPNANANAGQPQRAAGGSGDVSTMRQLQLLRGRNAGQPQRAAGGSGDVGTMPQLQLLGGHWEVRGPRTAEQGSRRTSLVQRFINDRRPPPPAAQAQAQPEAQVAAPTNDEDGNNQAQPAADDNNDNNALNNNEAILDNQQFVQRRTAARYQEIRRVHEERARRREEERRMMNRRRRRDEVEDADVMDVDMEVVDVDSDDGDEEGEEDGDGDLYVDPPNNPHLSFRDRLLRTNDDFYRRHRHHNRPRGISPPPPRPASPPFELDVVPQNDFPPPPPLYAHPLPLGIPHAHAHLNHPARFRHHVHQHQHRHQHHHHHHEGNHGAGPSRAGGGENSGGGAGPSGGGRRSL